MGPLPEKLRAFVAIRLSIASETAVADFVAELSSLGGGVRWTRRTNLHLTLRFLGGAAPAAMIPPLDTALAKIAAATEPFSLQARGTGVFPNHSRPRVVWIGLESPALTRLAAQIEEAARACGFPPETRPYAAHLTIGRVRDPRGWGRIRELLVRSADRDFGRSMIDSMSLYRSVLGNEASIYEELARYALSAPG